MKLTKNEHLGIVAGPDGQEYALHFYSEHGDKLGVAVISGPAPEDDEEPIVAFEAYREPACDALDAHAKLLAWRRAQGWPV